MKNKILEQLHYFNLKSSADSVFGDWVVTKDGDVVNYVYPYAIFASMVMEQDWLLDIKSKVWYNKDTFSDIDNALKRAKEILMIIR